jgi:hypothetical protein
METLVLKVMYRFSYNLLTKVHERFSLMETTQVSQESQVKDGVALNGKAVTKQPEEVRTDAVPSPLVGTLEAAIKEAVDEIRHCDEQAGLWLTRKQQLQAKMNETLERIQKQFIEPEKKAPRAARVDRNATVPDLIRTFLEKNGAQRTKEIRKFLLSHGRKTNPGVALSRMLKNGDLKSTERGVYRIA